MRLERPPDLPSAREQRYERVATHVADLDLVLPAPLAGSAAHLLLVSDFVLGVLLRLAVSAPREKA